MNTKITKLPKGRIEIEGEIDADIFEQFFDRALEKIGQSVELDGFRKGKVPKNILLSKVPEMSILEEMAEMALSEHYPKIINEHKLDVIDRPEIAITKLARKNPLAFKVKTTVLPEIKLPEYKDIAKKIITEIKEKEEKLEVTDEEIENTIMDIRKSRAPKKKLTEADDIKEDEVAKEDLPEFNDAYVKELGPFDSVADFKEKLRDNLKLEKENLAREKTRLKIIERVIDQSEIDVPEILVNLELDKILYRMESDIAQMGMKFEDYLNHLKKTRDDLRKEFEKDAEKKAKLALILNEIAKAEKIVADEQEVEREVAHILEHYKDADKERARVHAENVLTNEKIFQFLESL